MPTFDNGESGFSVRTKINAAIEKVDGAAPITSIDVNGGAIDGAIIGANDPVAVTATNLTASTDFTIASSTTVTAILDEDDLASDSATALATQQSIKAYVDGQVGDVNELSEILANGNTSGANDIIITASQKITVDTIDETTADGGVTIDSVLLKDGEVDGRDVAVDGAKLDGIEASADVTDTANVATAGALMTTGGNMTGNVTFGDNNKIVMGDSNDLQIYHDEESGASKIYDNGAGNLELISNGNGVTFRNPSDEETFRVFNSGTTILYHSRSFKLKTTSGGINVTGNIGVSGSVDGRNIAEDGTKLDLITVTQAVDLDQMETEIAALANGMVYKGNWNASSGSFPGSGSAQIGWFYYVSVAGTVSGVTFDIGDNIVATTDNASSSTYAGNWSKHDQTDAVQSVVGLTGSIAKSSLLNALNVEDGADVTDTSNVASSGALMTTGGNMTGNINYRSSRAVFGTSPNILQIYNDANNSYISETGTGNLRLRGNNIQLEQSTGGELYMQGAADGAVRLYHNGSQRLLTSIGGISVESDIAAANVTIRSTDPSANDGPRLDLYRDSATPAANDDIGQIYFSGENSAGGKQQYAKIDTFIESPTDGAETARLDINLLSAGDGINMFRLRTDEGGVNGEAVFNDSMNDVDFRVESGNSQTALKVDGGTGIVSMSEGLSLSGNLTLRDDDKIILGDSNDLQIYHDEEAGASKIYDAGAGNLELISNGSGVTFRNPSDEETFSVLNGGATTLYNNRNPKLTTASYGIDVDGQVRGVDRYYFKRASDDYSLSALARWNGTNGSPLRGTAGVNTVVGSEEAASSVIFAPSNVEKMRITSAGNAGIGTTSPNAYSGYTVLTLDHATNGGIIDIERGGNLIGEIFSFDASTFSLSAVGDRAINFSTNSEERLRITSDGDVRVGTTDTTITGIGSDSRKNMVVGGATGGEIIAYRNDNAVAGGEFIGALLFGHDDNTGTEDHFAGMWSKATSSAGLMDIHFAGGISNYETDTPQMTLKSDGNFLVGTEANIYGGKITVYRSNAGSAAIACINGATSGSARLVDFFRGTSTGRVGYISVNGSNVVTYNTGSDHRLKTDVQQMTGASARVQALNPVNFEWIVSGERSDGFIAHEAAIVVPEAVTGEKDAVDADGNPDYQGIDQSKMVPLLTAALREALTKIDSLEARIAALEA
tara:strand:+ start:9832 stop:13371 length:3540 start_codon:yes stop_codon:yes gene_type:complete